MASPDKAEQFAAIVKSETTSLQKASSGLVRRGLQDIERLTADPSVTELVAQMCRENDWKQREQAWLKLRKMGPTYRGWCESLRNAIFTGDGWSRIFAAESLSLFKCHPADAFPVLMAVIASCSHREGRDETTYDWGRLACAALMNYDEVPGNLTVALAATLVGVLNNTQFVDYTSTPPKQYSFRVSALTLLGRLGNKAELAMAMLAEMLLTWIPTSTL